MPLLIPPVADERSALLAFLEQQRYHLRLTLRGLTEDQARATPSASSMSLAALLKHVTWVERRWVVAALAGRAEGLWPVPDWEAEWRLTDDDTVPALLAFWDEVAKETTEIVHGIDLDQPCALDQAAHWSARWVLFHLIEELATHAGHADILRETVDHTTFDQLLNQAENPAS